MVDRQKCVALNKSELLGLSLAPSAFYSYTRSWNHTNSHRKTIYLDGESIEHVPK